MASTSNVGPSHPVLFTTKTPYPLPSQKFMIPSTWKRYQLSQLINKALSLSKPIPFDFLVRGEILRGSLGEWCAEKGAGEEETLEIEYVESVMPPEKMSSLPHEDWVSSVSCQIQGFFLTTSYDGHIRSFDYSQKLINSTQAHFAPISSLCVIPTSDSDSDSLLLATSSHDLTGHLTKISPASSASQSIASLHLHTAPLSSITTSHTGAHLLTSSWDGLIGVWDTTIPTTDEVPLDEVERHDRDRKKRRKIADDVEKAIRKAPVTVLKGHAARVSKVVFGKDETKVAYSCGFDSTVKMWDVENGFCTNTITASEKPFLDLAITSDGQTALAASTDRTISLYDLRSTTTHSTTAISTLKHAATPSCISPSAISSYQVVSGAYDGIVRLWDLRSVKSVMASFKTWDGEKKVLSVDWKRGVVGVGGEGGLEVWKIGENNS
ncbi:hypothetical protein PILCRDRAFT_822365 [Piloderma croceum F 1598]|uniref:Ribosome biogenesis protein YTM1 n=1 Tax=Piloderma croceum (strain F 1598) TaxID=765440 RepID=A0A0C3FLR0_PILCF|nr:hypothetical protein PILCRDRAFT_822365 [Piloderma croceum F 1598]